MGMRPFIPLGPPLDFDTRDSLVACALGTRALMFVLLVSIFPRSFYFTEYEIQTAVCHF